MRVRLAEETELQRRLRSRMEAAGFSARGLSRKAGLNESAVKNILSGKVRSPRHDTLQGLARALGCTIDQLAGDADFTESVTSDTDSDLVTMQSATIREISVQGGLGSGGEALVRHSGDTWGVDAVHGLWQMPWDYVSGGLQVDPEDVAIFPVVGDSMSPTLLSGDRVMVHLKDQRPSPPGIFALNDGWGITCKRLEPIYGSDPATVRLISDNPKHSPQERALDEIYVIGRIIWVGRQL